MSWEPEPVPQSLKKKGKENHPFFKRLEKRREGEEFLITSRQGKRKQESEDEGPNRERDRFAQRNRRRDVQRSVSVEDNLAEEEYERGDALGGSWRSGARMPMGAGSVRKHNELSEVPQKRKETLGRAASSRLGVQRGKQYGTTLVGRGSSGRA